MRTAGLLALLWALAGPALGHELQHRVAAAAAVTVHLAYADGKPFAYESYELMTQGSQTPVQVGKTDAEGRVVFLPGATTQWRLRVFSADGHGADFAFEAPAIAATAPAAAAASERWSRILLGLSVLLAAFAAFQFFARRKEPR